MTVKEFYDTIPSTVKNMLSLINTNIMDSAWSQTDTGISATDLIQLNNKVWLLMFKRELSFLIDGYCEINNINPENFTASTFVNLIKMLYSPYKDKWLRLWNDIYLKEYNSIWNVEGTDQTVHTFEHGKTTQETRNMTDTHNKGATETTTITSDITNNSRSGFNSATPVGTDSTSRTGSSHVTGSGNDSDVMTGTDTFTNSGVDTERTTLTRGMNIGVQSTQSLLEQEIQLRAKFNYFNIIIQDIINEFSLNIYI